MRINFFTPLTLPATTATPKQVDFEKEEESMMSDDSSNYSEGDSTSVDDASFDALADENDTALPELDSKQLKVLLLSPLEPDCDF